MHNAPSVAHLAETACIPTCHGMTTYEDYRAGYAFQQGLEPCAVRTVATHFPRHPFIPGQDFIYCVHLFGIMHEICL